MALKIKPAIRKQIEKLMLESKLIPHKKFYGSVKLIISDDELKFAEIYDKLKIEDGLDNDEINIL